MPLVNPESSLHECNLALSWCVLGQTNMAVFGEHLACKYYKPGVLG